MSSGPYDRLIHDSDAERLETSSFLSKEYENIYPSTQSSIRKTFVSRLLPLTASFLLGILFASSLFFFQRHRVPYGHYESGFSEEKIIPREAIQLEQRRFSTPVDFELNGHEFLVTEPGEKMYVGNATHDVDRNWAELLWGRYFSISENEAKRLWGDQYQTYWDHDRSGYTGGFDMFHQLHCLNQIRQALHPDNYHPTKIHGEVHTEHCINHLRQAIMCWASTAVIPIKFFPGYGHGYVQSDAVHTCRRWEPIREYVSERFNGSLAVGRPSGFVDMEENAF